MAPRSASYQPLLERTVQPRHSRYLSAATCPEGLPQPWISLKTLLALSRLVKMCVRYAFLFAAASWLDQVEQLTARRSRRFNEERHTTLRGETQEPTIGTRDWRRIESFQVVQTLCN